MADIYGQLTFKPGIQRDGTLFQGDFCTNGEWVRFQRGRVRKVGGRAGVPISQLLPAISSARVTDIRLVPNGNQATMFISDTNGVSVCTLDLAFGSVSIPQYIIGNGIGGYTPGDNTLWQSELIEQQGNSFIVFYAGANLFNINNNGADDTPNLFAVPLPYDPSNGIKPFTVPPLADGGIVFASYILFLYGSNGTVIYSANDLSSDSFANPTTDPIGTNGTPSNEGGWIRVSDDKVIYGASIRGGTDSPSVLFWTSTSVIRIANVTVPPVAEGQLATNTFRPDTLSETSSILSSRCVVEDAGLFFWPGSDKFYVFNGYVTGLPNSTSLNYFYNNLDFNKRQLVYGVKQTKYSEIWWYFPETKYSDYPEIGCTHVLIYNTDEKIWFDTACPGDAGFFSGALGFLTTYGTTLAAMGTSGSPTYAWRHENPASVNEVVSMPSYVMDETIVSSFTTPTFSFASFNPLNQSTGQKGQTIDKYTEIKRLEPDFGILGDTNNDNEIIDEDSMNFVVNTQRYAQSPIIPSTALGVPNQMLPFTFNSQTEKVDLRVQGRNLSITFQSTYFFEMGNVFMLLRIGDGQ